MLRLNNISLVQFKNYQEAFFSFPERITGIHGNNGVGKTNLLDAIYYLCFSKSYFSKSDQQHVKHGYAGFRIRGGFELNGKKEDVLCIVRETGKKELSLNEQPYERFSEHIGKFPCVIITPDDARIITEGSEERRRFADALLSQLDPQYLQNLLLYNRILQQRNSLLKSMSEGRMMEKNLLDVYDEQLASAGNYLFRQRTNLLAEALGLAKNYYVQIAGSDEPVSMTYDSPLQHGNFADLLRYNREKDLLLQRTSSGIHKDDIILALHEQPFKNIASQGQRKSLLFALKLAEFDMLKQAKGFAPVLLMDDVFEKLDDQRMQNLLQWVCVKNEGQIFITDTHSERIQQYFDALAVQYYLLGL